MALRQADFVLGARSVPQEEKEQLLAQLAFWGHIYAHDAFWPVGHGYNMGNTDMVAGVYATLGKIGCLLQNHPMARQWAQEGIAGMDMSLASGHHLPSRSQDEWYGHLTLDMITQAAVPLKEAGFHDFFKDPRYRHGLEFYGKLLTPPDPRYGGGYIVPFGNGQCHWNRSASWGVAARMTARSDPEFSRRMQFYWKRAGSPVGMKIGDRWDFGWMSLGWLDPALPTADAAFLDSTYVKGWGAVMRSAVGTDRETYMALQLGKPGGLRGYNAEGGFHLYAKGKPLCLLFGIRSWDVVTHNWFPNCTQQRWFANRPSFDEANEHCNGTGKLLEWSSLREADLAAGEWIIDGLARLPHPQPLEGPERLELSKPRRFKEDDSYRLKPWSVAPIRWQRRVLFVKDQDPLGPNYFLFRDDVDSKVPSDWNIWCLAEAMEVDEGQQNAHFKGKYDVDLDVCSVLPAQDVVTGAYGPPGGTFGFYRERLFQLQHGPDGDYLVLVYPRLRDEPRPEVRPWGPSGVCVETGSWTHYLVLSANPVSVEEEGAAFEGRAGLLRRDGKQRVVALLSAGAGRASLDGLTLETERVASVRWTMGTAAVTGELDGAAGPVRLSVPGMLAPTGLLMDGEKADCSLGDGFIEFKAPAGRHEFELAF